MNIRAWRYLLIAAVLPGLCACAAKTPASESMPAASSQIEGAALFEKRIEKLTDGVYCAIGYALGNVGMVAVDGGKVIIDATESVEAAREIKARFDVLAPGPAKAIVYTHTHADHILGASVFHEPAAPIWAHEKAVPAMNDQFASLGALLRYRAAKQYGEGLPKGLAPDNGIGPFLRMDRGPVPPLLYPTNTFSGRKEIAIGRVRFVLGESPGETEDAIFVWLPEKKVLFPGDDIYQAFPNLYSTRGAPPRPVKRWIESLDEMRGLGAEYLAPGHTGVLRGAEIIRDTLTVYRDAIKWVHDEVIRGAIDGKSPDDLAAEIKLPPHLRDHPYLRERYGKVSWSARGIYEGYLGWFDGNPANLNKLHPRERAARMVPLLGGREKVLEITSTAIRGGDLQWAAETADLLLALDEGDTQAKELKADALWALGLRSSNPNERCFLLSSAMELRGGFKPPERARIDADTLREVPIEAVLFTFPERLRPEKTADLEKTIGFSFTDTGKEYTFYIRRGIGEISPKAAGKTDLRFICSESDFKALLVGDLEPVSALASGRIKIEGGLSALLGFRSWLREK